jgi:hypothetical protein
MYNNDVKIHGISQENCSQAKQKYGQIPKINKPTPLAIIANLRFIVLLFDAFTVDRWFSIRCMKFALGYEGMFGVKDVEETAAGRRVHNEVVINWYS